MPFRLSAHLDRLQASLAAIKLANPHSRADWEVIFKRLCEANGAGNLSIYLQITRGSPTQRHHELPPEDCPPTVFAMVSNLPQASHEEGVSAVTLEDTRWSRCDIKSTALLANVLLRQDAVDKGADEAILHRDGIITEGAASTVFIVKGQQLSTPELNTGLLPGVTREVILDLAARHGLPFSCRIIRRAELDHAEEIWLTSSTKEVVPVVEIDGYPVGGGKVGAIFQAMRGWLDELKKEG
mgnify:CR=1 FL=1